jgi:GNAT superfamily N-acetyltransferase
VSDPDLEALAEIARNRGLKLIRSRVRTPGKRRFGKVGLADVVGKPVLGMDPKGPTGTPKEVEEYLRSLDSKDWDASLDVAGTPRKHKRKTRPREPANDSEAGPKRLSRATRISPKPQLRDAKPSDAPRLIELIHELGHEIDAKQVRKNLAALKKSGELPLLAILDKKIVGLCGISRRIVVHRPAPLGRITALVVTQDAQGHGIGRMLVEAAEQWMRMGGCQLVEVTSNDRRAEAHAFYRHIGYERTSIRFFKKL